MPNKLIIGTDGFVIYHLAQYLVSNGSKVYGFDRSLYGHSLDVLQGDLFERHVLTRTISETQPRII